MWVLQAFGGIFWPPLRYWCRRVACHNKQIWMPLLKHHHPRMSSSCDPGAHQLLWQVYAKSGHNPPSSQLPIAEESQVGLNRQVWESIQTGKGYSDIFPSADPFWPCSAYDASSRCFSVLWQWYLMSCLVGVKDLSPLRHGPWLQVNGITPKLRSSGSSFGVKKFHQYLYGWSCDNWSVTGD